MLRLSQTGVRGGETKTHLLMAGEEQGKAFSEEQGAKTEVREKKGGARFGGFQRKREGNESVLSKRSLERIGWVQFRR